MNLYSGWKTQTLRDAAKFTDQFAEELASDAVRMVAIGVKGQKPDLVIWGKEKINRALEMEKVSGGIDHELARRK